MKKHCLSSLKPLLIAFATLTVTLTAYADPSACEKPVEVNPFVLDESGLKRQASFINLWWTSAERKAMSHADAIAIRKADIDKIYLQVEAERRSAYANASCLVVNTKKCASTAGSRHTCPMTISAPANMRFDGSTLKNVDDDFDGAGGVPKLQANGTVTYTVKKTGRGSNTAGFQAMAAYTPEYIDSQVSAALDQVRAIVDPLVNNVDLSAVSQ